MPVNYDGYLSKPLKLLQNLICDSETFRSVVGAANATEAAAKVFWDEAFKKKDGTGDERPWVLINETDRTSIRNSEAGWDDDSALQVLFEFPVEFDGQHQTNEGPTGFRNTIEAIEKEMKTLLVQNPSKYLCMEEIAGPAIAPPDPKECDGEKFYGAFFVIHYKGDGSAG